MTRSSRGDEQPGKVRTETADEEWTLTVNILRGASSGVIKDKYISGLGK